MNARRYCSDSPCSETSRPIRSSSSRTRSGRKKPITFSSTKVTTPDQTSVTRDPVELDQHLPAVALDQAGGVADGGDREHAGQDRAGRAADAVHAEHVE